MSTKYKRKSKIPDPKKAADKPTADLKNEIKKGNSIDKTFHFDILKEVFGIDKETTNAYNHTFKVLPPIEISEEDSKVIKEVMDKAFESMTKDLNYIDLHVGERYAIVHGGELAIAKLDKIFKAYHNKSQRPEGQIYVKYHFKYGNWPFRNRFDMDESIERFKERLEDAQYLIKETEHLDDIKSYRT